MKKRDSKSNSKERQNIEVRSFSVDRVNQYNDTVYVNLTINGISINGCRIMTTKDREKDFIAFPSQKSKDGKYYNVVFAFISDEDQAAIIAEVEKELDAQEAFN